MDRGGGGSECRDDVPGTAEGLLVFDWDCDAAARSNLHGKQRSTVRFTKRAQALVGGREDVGDGAWGIHAGLRKLRAARAADSEGNGRDLYEAWASVDSTGLLGGAEEGFVAAFEEEQHVVE